jgi:hypothetical protein
MTNAPAYYDTVLIAAVKGFIEQVHGKTGKMGQLKKWSLPIKLRVDSEIRNVCFYADFKNGNDY